MYSLMHKRGFCEPAVHIRCTLGFPVFLGAVCAVILVDKYFRICFLEDHFESFYKGLEWI